MARLLSAMIVVIGLLLVLAMFAAYLGGFYYGTKLARRLALQFSDASSPMAQTTGGWSFRLLVGVAFAQICSMPVWALVVLVVHLE